MKAINLRGITESLSESEMKLVRGGAKQEFDPDVPELVHDSNEVDPNNI